MSQFTINGITFEDDKDGLQHGLGVGGGRGRPKGSRNGYINPNAAYMKNYKVVGEVADPLNTGMQPQNPPRQRTMAPAPQSQGPTRRMTNKEVNTKTAVSNMRKNIPSVSVRPATSVQNGKNLLEKALGSVEKTANSAGWALNKAASDASKSADRLWNGYDVTKAEVAPDGRYHGIPNDQYVEEGHVDGLHDKINDTISGAGNFLRDNVVNPVEQAANSAGRALNKATSDAVKSADRLWNGYDVTKADVTPEGRYHGVPNDQHVEEGHVEGLRDKITDSLVGAGDTAKDWWNGLLDWGEAAWNDLSGAATSAIDTGKGWAKTGLDWVNKNILDPAGDWGSRALSDIGGWLGERAGDLDRWWNGTDREIPASKGVPAGLTNAYQQGTSDVQRTTEHTPGFRENAGQWLADRGEDLNRWLYGYETTPTGSPEDRAKRQAGESRHVNGLFDNIAEGWQNNVVQPLENLWVGNQTIRGDQNGATSVEGNPGLRDILFDGYAREQPVRGVPAGLTNAYQQGTPDTTRVERVPGLVEQAGNVWNEFTGNVGRGVQDVLDTASGYVQRQIINPVTGAVETYLIDPARNAVVAVGEAVRDYVVNPARGAAQQINQNIVQPAATALNDYVVQPASAAASSAADAAGRAAEATGNAAANEYQYLQGSGDSYSDFARRGNVPSSVVDGINRSAASNGRSYQENLETRAEIMQMLGTLSRNGVLSGNEIQRMYRNSQNSPDVLNSLYNEVLNAYMNATPRNSIRNSDR